MNAHIPYCFMTETSFKLDGEEIFHIIIQLNNKLIFLHIQYYLT